MGGYISGLSDLGHLFQFYVLSKPSKPEEFIIIFLIWGMRMERVELYHGWAPMDHSGNSSPS